MMSLMLPVWSGRIPLQLIILEGYLRGWISLVMPWMTTAWRKTNNQSIPNQRNMKICKSDTAIDRGIFKCWVSIIQTSIFGTALSRLRPTLIYLLQISAFQKICTLRISPILNKWCPFHCCRTTRSTHNIWTSFFFSHITSWILSFTKL